MSDQSWRRCRRDVNDDLFSKIIRHGQKKCWRCLRTKEPASLQAAHIVGRGSYTTRFQLEPVRNAIPLCADCHDHFDSHKMRDLIFEPEKRVFTWKDESYTFLVEKCGYTWRDLQKLYISGQGTIKIKYQFWKKAMTLQLRQFLNVLNEGTEKEAA